MAAPKAAMEVVRVETVQVEAIPVAQATRTVEVVAIIRAQVECREILCCSIIVQETWALTTAEVAAVILSTVGFEL